MRTKISVRTLRWQLLALGAALAIRQWIWMPGLITGDSMQPTLRSGQLVGINKLVYHFDMPRRGDIVEFWTGRELMVKRVLGLPDDQIEVRGGVFYINGRPLAEPYLQVKDDSDIAPGRLGPEHFLVAGDNRSQTIIAVVNRKRIVGRVQCPPLGAQVAVIKF